LSFSSFLFPLSFFLSSPPFFSLPHGQRPRAPGNPPGAVDLPAPPRARVPARRPRHPRRHATASPLPHCAALAGRRAVASAAPARRPPRQLATRRRVLSDSPPASTGRHIPSARTRQNPAGRH
jgi:hypothetical protein